MKTQIGILLSFEAGFCDTATFVGANGVFSAHVTGNVVLFAVTLAHGLQKLDYLKLLLFVPFLLGVALVSGLSRNKNVQKNFESNLFGIAGLALISSGLYFAFRPEVTEQVFDWANFFVLLVAFAMGVQSGVARIAAPTFPATTVMTGNSVQFVLEMLGYHTATGTKASHYKKAWEIARFIGGFALGCFSAAGLLSHGFTLGILLIPAALILFVCALYRRYKISIG